MTLATNVMSTSAFTHRFYMNVRSQYSAGLLAFRIWQVKRQSRQFLGSNALSPLLRVVIESGAIYSMSVTAALITFVTKSNGVYVVLDIVRPLYSVHSPRIILTFSSSRQ